VRIEFPDDEHLLSQYFLEYINRRLEYLIFRCINTQLRKYVRDENYDMIISIFEDERMTTEFIRKYDDDEDLTGISDYLVDLYKFDGMNEDPRII
jgi:hypothetical protein